MAEFKFEPFRDRLTHGALTGDALKLPHLFGGETAAERQRLDKSCGLVVWSLDSDLHDDTLKRDPVLVGVHTHRHVDASRQGGLQQLMSTEAGTVAALVNRSVSHQFLPTIADNRPVGS